MLLVGWTLFHNTYSKTNQQFSIAHKKYYYNFEVLLFGIEKFKMLSIQQEIVHFEALLLSPNTTGVMLRPDHESTFRLSKS